MLIAFWKSLAKHHMASLLNPKTQQLNKPVIFTQRPNKVKESAAFESFQATAKDSLTSRRSQVPVEHLCVHLHAFLLSNVLCTTAKSGLSTFLASIRGGLYDKKYTLSAESLSFNLLYQNKLSKIIHLDSNSNWD